MEGKTISNIEGNIQGLKHNQIQRLEKLYNRRIPPHQIVTQEFARQLSEISHERIRQIGVLVNRNGYVEYVVVGNARSIVLPDLKRVRMGAERFRGLRCLHTHLSGEGLTLAFGQAAELGPLLADAAAQGAPALLPFERAAAAAWQRYAFLVRTLLLLSRAPPLRRRILRLLAHHPRFFSRLLDSCQPPLHRRALEPSRRVGDWVSLAVRR